MKTRKNEISSGFVWKKLGTAQPDLNIFGKRIRPESSENSKVWPQVGPNAVNENRPEPGQADLYPILRM